MHASQFPEPEEVAGGESAASARDRPVSARPPVHARTPASARPPVNARPQANALSNGALPLDEMLTRYLPGLKGFIRVRMEGLLKGKESSSDLVQSVCREVIEHIDRFEHQSEDGFRQWLYRTAERKTIDRLRYYTARKRNVARETNADPELLDCGCSEAGRSLFPSPSHDAIAREELRRAQEAFDGLPEDYQTVIVLFRVQGLSHAEIAERMGRSEGAVRNLLYRGLAAISDALGD